MGQPQLVSKGVNASPTRAPANYREMAPWVERTPWRACGSGIPLRDVPVLCYWWQRTCPATCGEYGSSHTLCIYAYSSMDISGKWDEYELECLDCARCTVYVYS